MSENNNAPDFQLQTYWMFEQAMTKMSMLLEFGDVYGEVLTNSITEMETQAIALAEESGLPVPRHLTVDEYMAMRQFLDAVDVQFTYRGHRLHLDGEGNLCIDHRSVRSFEEAEEIVDQIHLEEGPLALADFAVSAA